MDSDELSLRVGQLGSARSRARLACALRGAVELADRQPEPFGMPRSQIRRTEIRASRELLLELAERVGSRGPVGVEGLAHDVATHRRRARVRCMTATPVARSPPPHSRRSSRSSAATRRPTPSTARARGAGGWSVGTGWVSGPMPRTLRGRHARWAEKNPTTTQPTDRRSPGVHNDRSQSPTSEDRSTSRRPGPKRFGLRRRSPRPRRSSSRLTTRAPPQRPYRRPSA